MSRTAISKWTIVTGTYIQTIGGYDILINGTDKYLNFNTISGSTGYGFRDLSGVMQVKNSGIDWGNIYIGEGTAKITVASSAPSNPQVGDLWVDTT